jgi:hypothetical protein
MLSGRFATLYERFFYKRRGGGFAKALDIVEDLGSSMISLTKVKFFGALNDKS